MNINRDDDSENRRFVETEPFTETRPKGQVSINGLFQFMNTDICESFFRDVTTENMSETLEQLMQNPEFLEQTKVFVDDVSILRQKVVTKLGQLCKKKKTVKEDEPISPPAETSKPKPKLVDGYELQRIQYAIDDDNNTNEAYLKENTSDVPDSVEPLDESLGKHIGEGIYLLQEGHVFKMTTPQFVVYY